MPRCATQLPWGYEEVRQNQSADPIQQYANLPAALLSTLKREKKPFTYTPGGVNLSEVLEARLQKRLERKKKYQEQEAGRLLVVSPTYNSPLNMYSVENALETLEVQAKMAANSRPLSCATLPRNYKFKFEEGDDDANEPPQSKAFRVLQVMTDTEPIPGDKRGNKGSPQAMSAMRFSGLREGRTTNPSKFFHNLQKITGTEEDEEQEQERQESIIKFEKQRCVNPPQSQQQQATPQPCSPFGSAPKLKRPAAFLPKQQLWSYQRTPVGTDF